MLLIPLSLRAEAACKEKAADTAADKLAPYLAFENIDDQNARACAKTLKADADDSVLVAAELPNQIDPPVDSILHSVNFVITYGATIAPSWTLIQWKGPAQSGNLAGATGIQTNTLDLALGPRTRLLIPVRLPACARASWGLTLVSGELRGRNFVRWGNT